MGRAVWKVLWISPERWAVEQIGQHWEMKSALLPGEAMHVEMACSQGAESDGLGHTENLSSSPRTPET